MLHLHHFGAYITQFAFQDPTGKLGSKAQLAVRREGLLLKSQGPSGSPTTLPWDHLLQWSLKANGTVSVKMAFGPVMADLVFASDPECAEQIIDAMGSMVNKLMREMQGEGARRVELIREGKSLLAAAMS